RSRRSGRGPSRCGRCCAGWGATAPGTGRAGLRRRSRHHDVGSNQVLVRLVDGPTTEALIEEIQADGGAWCGPTQWAGATAMHISVSSWKTDLHDAEEVVRII